MIVNRSDEPPAEWTNADIAELIDHANELALNGNPAGFFVCSDLSQIQPTYPISNEEYAICRVWIKANADLVRTAWQYEVRRI